MEGDREAEAEAEADVDEAAARSASKDFSTSGRGSQRLILVLGKGVRVPARACTAQRNATPTAIRTGKIVSER